jgi:homogentisate phytyltransferase/homogentisate geranylgeranyltransferase
VVGHAVLGFMLYSRAKTTDVQDSKSIYSCYMFVWKLFYAEYLLIPLLR